MSQGSNSPKAAGNAATGRDLSWPSTRPSVTTAPKALSGPEHQPSSDTWPATARGSGERQTCCPGCAWPDHLGSASGLLASSAVFPCLFFSFLYVFPQPNTVRGRIVVWATCRLGRARLGRGVQESRGRSWIDRRERCLHTTDPAGAASREEGHGLFVVLFVLYIIVVAVVEFHLDTTNTPLISHDVLMPRTRPDLRRWQDWPRWQEPCVLSPTRRFRMALADVPSLGATECSPGSRSSCLLSQRAAGLRRSEVGQRSVSCIANAPCLGTSPCGQQTTRLQRRENAQVQQSASRQGREERPAPPPAGAQADQLRHCPVGPFSSRGIGSAHEQLTDCLHTRSHG